MPPADSTAQSVPGAARHSPSLIDSIPTPAYACDAAGRITDFNERAATLWGRRPKLNDSADRYCGALALLAPDGTPLPHACSPAAVALAEGRPCEGREAVVVRPDGTRRTVLYHVEPMHDEQGTVRGANAVLVDVTEREETQRAARAALLDIEASFRGFFDSVAVGAVQVNSEGRIISANDRFCGITGYSREELLTMTPFDLDPPEDRWTDLERVKSALADPAGTYHAEKRYLRKDGTYVWVHVAANILRDASGRPVQTAAIVLDISERKRAEQALQEADRMKDDFLATLAHELRNPLAPLTSAADLLRHADHGEVGWCREVVDRQVRHLTRLIDDLLDVSRITRDKLELRKARITLADVIRGAVEASRPMLERCEQTLKADLPAEPVLLDGDAVRLTQVFTNLLTNAAKFTRSAGTIRIVAQPEGAGIEVRVIDSGIGIAKEELGRVFEKFYQSPHRGERFLGGLGIGLSLVRKLVELHGGSIEARSAGIGHGSEFVVRLPVAKAEARAVTRRSADSERDGARRILIVDDNVDGADTLGRLLRVMGHEAVTVYDGQAALRRTDDFEPDIVFLDLGMAGMDGFEVCRCLRERLRRSARIVALTGWGRKEDVARTRQAGFDAHLVKPADRAALERLLTETAPLPGAGAAA
ncbi:MAG: PAS domain S-box protein [Gammaproteobacteria bacterium]|nr:PAS domain S-box protein [Gammaproteobacteria bacterium]